jgi:lipoprotein
MTNIRFWRILLLGLSFCFFTGCTDDNTTNQNVLVQVGDWSLYRDDIPLDVYEGKTQEDSTREVKLYIENWVRSALLYRYAEQQIGKDNPTVERRVADYRRALYTQSFESDYVRNNLDTSVSEAEMKDFYEANRDLFTLKRTIVRVLLLKIPENSQYIDEVKKNYTLTKGDESMQQLSNLSMKAGIQFLVMPEEWAPLTSLGRYLPADVDITFGNRRARTAEFIDNGVVYLLSFQEWKGVGELAPYEYVRPEVHSIILNRREVNLLRELEEGIVKEGLASKIVKYKN